MWKWSFSSFCVSNFFTHLTQENFLGLEYFFFSLYSTVLNTFGFGLDFSLLAEVSIFIAVPSTLGSNTILMLLSSASFVVACASVLVFGTVPTWLYRYLVRCYWYVIFTSFIVLLMHIDVQQLIYYFVCFHLRCWFHNSAFR